MQNVAHVLQTVGPIQPITSIRLGRIVDNNQPNQYPAANEFRIFFDRPASDDDLVCS
jgi:hypothetical protein